MGDHSFDYRIRLDRRVADYQAHYERLTKNTFLLDRKVFVCVLVKVFLMMLLMCSLIQINDYFESLRICLL